MSGPTLQQAFHSSEDWDFIHYNGKIKSSNNLKTIVLYKI